MNATNFSPQLQKNLDINTDNDTFQKNLTLFTNLPTGSYNNKYSQTNARTFFYISHITHITSVFAKKRHFLPMEEQKL